MQIFIAIVTLIFALLMPTLVRLVSADELRRVRLAVDPLIFRQALRLVQRGEVVLAVRLCNEDKSGSVLVPGLGALLRAGGGNAIDGVKSTVLTLIRDGLAVSNLSSFSPAYRFLIVFGGPLLILWANGWGPWYVTAPLLISMAWSGFVSGSITHAAQRATVRLQEIQGLTEKIALALKDLNRK